MREEIKNFIHNFSSGKVSLSQIPTDLTLEDVDSASSYIDSMEYGLLDKLEEYKNKIHEAMEKDKEMVPKLPKYKYLEDDLKEKEGIIWYWVYSGLFFFLGVFMGLSSGEAGYFALFLVLSIICGGYGLILNKIEIFCVKRDLAKIKKETTPNYDNAVAEFIESIQSEFCIIFDPIDCLKLKNGNIKHNEKLCSSHIEAMVNKILLKLAFLSPLLKKVRIILADTQVSPGGKILMIENLFSLMKK